VLLAYTTARLCSLYRHLCVSDELNDELTGKIRIGIFQSVQLAERGSIGVHQTASLQSITIAWPLEPPAECEFDSRHSKCVNFLWDAGHADCVMDDVDTQLFRQMASRGG